MGMESAEDASGVMEVFDAYTETLDGGAPYVYLSPAFVGAAGSAALEMGAWSVLRDLIHRKAFSGLAHPGVFHTLLEGNQWGLVVSTLVHTPDLSGDMLFDVLLLLLEAREGESSQGHKVELSITAFFEAVEAGSALVEDVGFIPELTPADSAAIMRKLRMGSDSAVDSVLSLVIGYPHVSSGSLRSHLRSLSLPSLSIVLRLLLRWISRYARRSPDDLAALRSPLLPTPSLQQVLEWVILALDTHFADFVLDPTCRAIVADLVSMVESELGVCDQIQGISGILSQLYSKTSRLVVPNVPDYSIELLQL